MAAARQQQQLQKIRSELAGDSGGDRASPLPPPVEHGLRKAIEYHFDDKGNEVKVAATTTRERDPAPAPLSRNAIESHSWPKFCDSVKEDGSLLTMAPTGEILIERPHSSVTGTSVKSSPSVSDPAEPHVCPICKRAAGRSAADMMGCRDDDTSVQVTNLSENTSEHDLRNLFCPFGIINDFSLALDEKTGSRRQFGIVEFDQREDAEEAISWLNGYSYDSLPLQVEMITTGLKEACDSPSICSACMSAAETSVHVTNLPEDTCERDIYNLFCPFGVIHRFYLASVDKTASGTQSGIVEFDQREDAEEAISWLNGYHYGNQILQVKWATAAELGACYELPACLNG